MRKKQTMPGKQRFPACIDYDINHNLVARFLTPLECERLQGLPDNYTKIPFRKKLPEYCPKGLRYSAIGNSIAVPCLQWIGKRINMVNTLIYGSI
jgi:site-specific DNA-cytosine methylase